MKYYRAKFSINILAYCLMPNHFHLFVQQTTDEFSISIFLSSLLNSYVKAVNQKYKRSGTLFESKTKSKQIVDEAYFKWVIKYILENPVNAGLAERISDWEFSNAMDLLTMRNGTISDINNVASFFQSKEGMIEFLTDKTVKTSYEF